MDPYDNYQSPFSWRYASDAMRSNWSENNKRRLWRRIWVALAKIQSEFGLVAQDQVLELQAHAGEIDVEAALRIEAEIHHDLMAELKTFAAQCPHSGGVLHMGATSMDIEDNADALRLRSALDLVLATLRDVLLALAERMQETAALPIMAFTHIQPAEPSTMGYRFAMYAQDLMEDFQNILKVRTMIRGKGFKGAVGTAAAYVDLIGIENVELFESRLSQELDLPFYEVSTQTYTRKQDYDILSALAGMGASLHKFAFDLRLLQTPPIGEISEPFGKKQVGSSAMPFKRNPINAEKIDSLARQLSMYPQVAWQNAANSLLERTLDDSANRRTILPEAFLICDELLRVALRLVKNLNIRTEAIQHNLEIYAPFACTERVMMAVSKKGADRQEMHELLREHALTAWQVVQSGGVNPLVQYLQVDETILKWISAEEIMQLSKVSAYTGIAEQRTRLLAARIRQMLG
ncbi:MAG: adenylosuccinate lyase [Chloroflexi bacterium HGW-Chloroflexi-10]|nr:MAG: adenylosuccinate lyase [Chloroflexi bacterium HGW-Chloroflexi-10]